MSQGLGKKCPRELMSQGTNVLETENDFNVTREKSDTATMPSSKTGLLQRTHPGKSRNLLYCAWFQYEIWVAMIITGHDFLGSKRLVWTQVLVSLQQPLFSTSLLVLSLHTVSSFFSLSSFQLPLLKVSKGKRFPGFKGEVRRFFFVGSKFLSALN